MRGSMSNFEAGKFIRSLGNIMGLVTKGQCGEMKVMATSIELTNSGKHCAIICCGDYPLYALI